MDDTSGIEHQPREGAEANVCGFSTVYFVSKALDGILELAATRKYSDARSAWERDGGQRSKTHWLNSCLANKFVLCDFGRRISLSRALLMMTGANQGDRHERSLEKKWQFAFT